MEQKNFPATPRKRRHAREQGQVVLSPDLLTGFFLLIVTLMLQITGEHLFDQTSFYLQASLEQIRTESFPQVDELSGLLMSHLSSSGSYFLTRLWPVWGLSLVVIVTVSMQSRGLVHWPAIKPDPQRINPARGLARFTLAELSKRFLTAGIKLSGLSLLAWSWACKQHELKAHGDLRQQISAEMDQLIAFLLILSIGLMIWGVVDYFWRRSRFEKQLRMSARELADEQKQFSPDPQIQQKASNIRGKWTTGVIMNPQTDLLVTDGLANSVLLRYQPEIHKAPIILARDSGSSGVLLLNRCLQADIVVHEDPALQQILSRQASRVLSHESWAEIAEIYGKIAKKHVKQSMSPEPATIQRVGSFGE